MRESYKKEPRAKTPEQALSALMAQCARAERSTGDARRLMTRWGVAAEDQQGVIDRLISERFIDDSRYAAAYVRDKINLSGWGVYKIRMGLAGKGISKEIIDEQMEQLDGESMRERLEELIAKRARTTKYTTIYQLRDKLIRYGASQGYNFSMVSEVVGEVLKQSIELEEIES